MLPLPHTHAARPHVMQPFDKICERLPTGKKRLVRAPGGSRRQNTEKNCLGNPMGYLPKKQEWSERAVRELTRIPDKREADGSAQRRRRKPLSDTVHLPRRFAGPLLCSKPNSLS